MGRIARALQDHRGGGRNQESVFLFFGRGARGVCGWLWGVEMKFKSLILVNMEANNSKCELSLSRARALSLSLSPSL